MSQEFDTLFELPDYENRCNAFVQQVLDYVKPKYPDLQINAENQTLKQIDAPTQSQHFTRFIRDPKEKQRLTEVFRRISDGSDILSSSLNIATVDVWAGEDELRTLAIDATGDVIKTSIQFNPEEVKIDYFFDNRPHLSHIWLLFS